MTEVPVAQAGDRCRGAEHDVLDCVSFFLEHRTQLHPMDPLE